MMVRNDGLLGRQIVKKEKDFSWIAKVPRSGSFILLGCGQISLRHLAEGVASYRLS